MKKLIKKPIVKMTNEDKPDVSPPKIDKLSAVIDVPDQALCGLAYSTALDWIQQQEEVGFTKAKSSARYPLAVNIHFPGKDGVLSNKGPSLLLQITSKKASKPQVRIEYNPAYVDEDVMDHLNIKFTELFDMDFYQFLFHARFTRIDVCRDILGCEMTDYLFKGKNKKVSQCMFGANGKLGTIYLGTSVGNKFSIYDKAAELYGPDTDIKMFRIESKSKTNLTVKQLLDFKNPFVAVKVYSMRCKNPPFGLAHWRAFMDSCRLRGIGNAIKNQPYECRAKLKKAISEHPVSWWDIPSEEAWGALWLAALIQAGLGNIPKWAPPLKLNYQSAA